MRIGRRSASRGIEPEIDLTGPPADPGISHLHAVLLAEPHGGWAVLDPGSSNGTMVNGRDISAGERVALHEGDRIAWARGPCSPSASDSRPVGGGPVSEVLLCWADGACI
jgi:pSer/pThr/pTyr-binding forkhead associated (FHA) protein